MEVTPKVYAELLKQAKRMRIMKYSFVKTEYEDIIQQAAISLFNQNKEPKTQDELEKMCCMTIKSRAIDFIRKKKLHVYQSQEAHDFAMENLTVNEDNLLKEKMCAIRLFVTPEEFEFMMSYLESKEIKTSTEKSRFFRLKNKIKKKLLTPDE